MKIISKTVISFFIVILCSMLFDCTQSKQDHESEIRELHHRYMEASINHDIKTLETLTHDSIIWYIGPYIFKGKEEALAPNEFDKGYETILEYSNVVVKGDTVRFELLETNDQVKFFGMDGIMHYPQFVFKDGLVYRKISWKPTTDMAEFGRRNKPFRDWVRANHPEAMKTILKPDSSFNFSFETGQLVLQLFNQYKNEKNTNQEIK